MKLIIRAAALGSLVICCREVSDGFFLVLATDHLGPEPVKRKA